LAGSAAGSSTRSTDEAFTGSTGDSGEQREEQRRAALAAAERRVAAESERSQKPKCVSLNGREFCRELSAGERRLLRETGRSTPDIDPREEALFLSGVDFVQVNLFNLFEAPIRFNHVNIAGIM
jgi:hypothetical protein